MHLSYTILAQLPVTVCVCVSVVLYALCAGTRVMQDAGPAGMWLQAFSAIRSNCQDASLSVCRNKPVRHKQTEKVSCETFPSAPAIKTLTCYISYLSSDTVRLSYKR